MKLCDSTTGKLLKTLVGHTVDVRCLAFSPDGKILATGLRDRTIRLWNGETEKPWSLPSRVTRIRFAPWLSQPTAKILPP